jgi:hypothetical protein
VLAEEKLDDIGARLEYTPRKSLKHLALTHVVMLHPMKVGVWCPVCARRIVRPVFFNEKLIMKDMYGSFSGSSFQS